MADKISFLQFFVSFVFAKFHYNKNPYVSLPFKIAQSFVLQHITAC